MPQRSCALALSSRVPAIAGAQAAPSRSARAPTRDPAVARWLALTGEDPPDLSADRLAAFTRILLLVVAVDHWDNLGYWAGRAGFGAHVVLAAAVSACAALAWRRASVRLAAGLAALPVAIDLVWAFPDHANHQYVALVCMAIVALFDPERPEEAGAALGGLRWLVVLGLAWAGLQKLLYGYYFDGTFLSFAIAQRDTFAAAFAWILSDAEIVRLTALPFREGAGPFRAEGPWLDWLANATWIAEIGLAGGMLFARTRVLAAGGAMALIAMIELAAREVFFGMIMFALLLLFWPGRAGPRSVPGFALASALLLATLLGWIPDWTFT